MRLAKIIGKKASTARSVNRNNQFFLVSSNNIKFINNVVENFRTGVIMGDAYDWSIHGNTIRLNGSDGVLVTNNDTSVSLFAMTGGCLSTIRLPETAQRLTRRAFGS
ncbi:hypothetical protein GRI33_00995 [Brucella sp. BO3]|uniref:NosD domain-containing protein n=1 Tax=Brucella sp. BO3 TaxID=2691913 RepID=UPI00159F06F2|nr:hypothetical protein GRI33_00995 [Brucella sp. BO3]